MTENAEFRGERNRRPTGIPAAVQQPQACPASPQLSPGCAPAQLTAAAFENAIPNRELPKINYVLHYIAYY